MEQTCISKKKDPDDDRMSQSSSPKRPRLEDGELSAPSTSSALLHQDVFESSPRSKLVENINITGVSGHAAVTNAITIGFQDNSHNVTTTNNYSNKETELRTPLESLSEQTRNLLRERTENMIKTAAFDEIKMKLEQGKRWINIIGAPGDGKTTATYLTLEHCLSIGKNVFIINSTESYDIASQVKENCILLFDDMFGTFDFDCTAIEKWKNVLESLLKLKLMDNPECDITVLNVQRTRIFNTALKQIGKYKRLINQNNSNVNVTSLNSSFEEKNKMWLHYGKKFHISDKVVEVALGKTIPYGFPSCCQTFSDMYSKDNTLDMVEFFSKPLQFINEEMDRLLDSERNIPLFKLLLKAGGSVDLCEDDETQKEFRETASGLKDTLFHVKNGIVSFRHNAFYDSAAACLLHKDPIFTIRTCDMSVLCRITSSSEFDFAMEPSYLDEFLKRCNAKIMDYNILPVLSHKLCANQEFVNGLMKRSVNDNTEALEDTIKRKDKTSETSFLFLSTKSGSPMIFQYICHHIKLSPEEQSEALFGICRYDTKEALKHFIETYKDFDFDKDNNGQTPEMAAAAAGSENCFKILSQTGNRTVALTRKDHIGKTSLHYICETGGMVQTVRDLIVAGAKVNEVCSRHMSPLHYAASNGHADIASELIKWGADVDMSSMATFTPLHYASMNGHTSVIEVLLDHDAKNDYEPYWSPVHRARSNGHTHSVRTLLRRCPFPAQTNLKSTLLTSACADGDTVMIDTLKGCGANINEATVGHFHPRINYLPVQNDVREHTKETTPPLLIAYLHGQTAAVRHLIELGADVNRKASDGCAVFSNVCKQPEERTILHLLNGNIDENLTDIFGTTILHTACWYMFEFAVQRLLEIGADVNKENSRSLKTSIHIACEAMSGPVLSDTPSQSEEAGLKKQMNIITMLVKKGADVNRRDTNANTPLHTACRQKLPRVARFLLEKGADLTLENRSKKTPLYLLCDENSKVKEIMSVAEEMIEKGASKDELRGWYKGEYLGKQAGKAYKESMKV